MRTTIYTLVTICLSVYGVHAQIDNAEAALTEAEIETTATVQKSEYQLKLEEKEAKKTAEAIFLAA